MTAEPRAAGGAPPLASADAAAADAAVADAGQRGDPRGYGWVGVAASFIYLTIGGGYGFYSLSTYANYLTEHNGVSLTVASIGSTVYFLVSGAAGLVVARLVHLSIRLPLYLGTLGLAVTLPLLGHVHNAWQLWFAYALYGLGSAGLGVVTASTLVIRWFPSSPGRPLAVATTGMSVGGAVVAPLVATLVASRGLPQASLLMVTVAVVVLVPITTFFVRYPRTPPPGSPELPDSLEEFGDERAVEEVAADTPEGSAPPGRRLLVFLVTCLAFGLLLLSQVAAVTHMITLATERGLTNGPLALSVLAFTSVAGRLVGIPLLPVIGLRVFTVGNALLQAVAMVVLANATTDPLLLLGAGLLGATVGNTVVLLPLSILDSFGLREYPELYARSNLVTTFGVACSPLLAGAMESAFGGYLWPFVVLAGGSAVAGALLLVLPRQHPASAGPVSG
jgi:MFS family permease